MPKRMLIVDDSTISLELVRAGFTQAGYEVVAASNLAQLAEALKTGPFHGAVLDLEMPETFGDDLLEFLREVRQIKAPIILYSDIGEKILAERAALAKADGYVPKSEGLPKLIQTVQAMIDQQEAKKASARRVMIVDDSEMTAKLIEAELKGKGFEVILADSVDKATRLILKKQTRPELILLDVNMPNVDGGSFCRFIKGNSLFKGIKVVLCSGIETEKLKSVAAACGADGIVPKDSFLSKWVLEQIDASEAAGKK